MQRNLSIIHHIEHSFVFFNLLAELRRVSCSLLHVVELRPVHVIAEASRLGSDLRRLCASFVAAD